MEASSSAMLELAPNGNGSGLSAVDLPCSRA
ncbi:hypothetical protein A2U01_0056993, partial [Trifolium medium]|nr:hypothetical protein [Trifolium medium]